jgi:predicted AAA+ superfamily ATPase
MEILNLWPFSVGELRGVREGFIDRLFERGGIDAAPLPNLSRKEIVNRIVIGGYPEVTQRSDAERRRAWFSSYITTILQRDVRAMADIEGLAVLPRMLSFLAAQSGGLLNAAELSRDAGFSLPTTKRYLTLLQATHLYQPLYAWSGNVRKRLIKAPKVYLNDTGLLSHLLGLSAEQLADPSSNLGRALEAFVCQELRKQITWSRTRPSIYYYRTAAGREVDFVLERRGGGIVGIEVKAAVKLGGDDLKGLADLEETVGKRFLAGVVLYQGNTIVPFGPKRYAVPLSAMFTE